jgi:hypothetical protein
LASYELSREYAVKVVESQEGTPSSQNGGVSKVTESAMYQNASKSIMDIQVKVMQREDERSRKKQRKDQMDTMRYYKDRNHIKNID